MTQTFPTVRCLGFLAVLVGLFYLSTIYRDYLFELSHQLIKDLQENRSEDDLSVRFFAFFSDCCESNIFTFALIFLLPFMSRERFWYYLIAIQASNQVKDNFKMILSQPRPNWVWSDLNDTGCSESFGSPSGHSTRCANLAFLLVLDLFFPSEWSRQSHPSLNKRSVKTHKCTFAAVTFLSMTFWLLMLFDRVFLGKHAVDQILLGSQLGIWSAFFSHFILRDPIFDHMAKVCHRAGEMTKASATKYCLLGGFLIPVFICLTSALIGTVMASKGHLQQKWLINMRDTCGYEYAVSAETGLLVANQSGMYTGTMIEANGNFGVAGLYVG